jgi:CBS domain-containing protein
MEVGELTAGTPAGCDPKSTIAEAAAVMDDLDIGSLAIYRGSDLIGIVTERDVVRAVANDVSMDDAVETIMTPDPDTVEADVDVVDAAAWLLAVGYRHLPVTSEGKLVGLISMKDLLDVLARDAL